MGWVATLGVSHAAGTAASAGTLLVTYGIMCQWGKGYSLWLSKSHEEEHPDATAYCDD